MIDFNEVIEFVRPVYEHVKDLFILDVEAFRDFTDEFKHHIPDSLGESEFHAAHGGILEESAYGFVVGEALGRGEQAVLHGRDGGHRNLRGKVSHLVLAQPEVLLALLKDDFQGPAHGVNPVGLGEVELSVCRDETVPLAPLATPGEEQAHVAACKGHVHGDVVATQPAAVAASLPGLVEEGDELAGGVPPAFVHVLRPAHLDHPEIVAPDVTGSDEQDDLRAGEPAVGQHIVEAYLALDNPAYHPDRQGYLALAVLFGAQCGMGAFLMLPGEPGVKLALLQAMLPVLALLADEGEVEQHLAEAVGYADEQPLEAEHHRMCHVGVYLADKLRPDATLGIVRVVHHQADWIRAVGSPPLLALAPELPGNDGENLAPVVRLIGDKPVEHVLTTVKQAAWRGLAVVVGIANHETGKQHQQSEHLHLRQLAVALALTAEKPFFGQPQGLCHIHYRIHRSRGIIFLEKFADL